jgi:hypothetical protein
MLSRAIAGVLAARLVLAPFAAADDDVATTTIRAAAAREAGRHAPVQTRGPMRPGLKWTGIGLLLAGSMTTLTAALDNCGTRHCNKGTGLAVGGAEVVAGSMLLALADRHRLPAAPTRRVLAPCAAADPQTSETGPIAASAARQAAAVPPAPPPARGPMPTGLKWTGLGMLMGSTAPIALAKLGDCIPERPACDRDRRALYIASGIIAGTGASLLAIGHAKRGPSPIVTLDVGGGRATLVQRIAF